MNRVASTKNFEKLEISVDVTNQIESGEVALYIPTKIIKSSCHAVLNPTRKLDSQTSSMEIYNEKNQTEIHFLQELSSTYFFDKEISLRILGRIDEITYPFYGMSGINLVGLMEYDTDEETINLFYESITL